MSAQAPRPAEWLSALFFLVTLLAACEFPSRGTPVPTTSIPAPSRNPTETAQLVTSTPMPTPVLPTRPPTEVPRPTPTFDPERAEWTVMVYLDADNNLELSGLLDVNEMEAAGTSSEVNLLVQIDRAAEVTEADGDWTDARRYLIRADKDPNVITTQPTALLGEVNMGDPNVLADFLSWGISNYPANRYALILWDHGAGWNGFAFDADVGFADEADHISLSDLEMALANALSITGLDRFDVIAFDACLMGQLDVLQAVRPFAHYAVGSEELTPGQGWDYESTLRRLYNDPNQDGATFAGQMVDDFAAFYRLDEPDDFVTMAAVDLAMLPDLVHAVEALATALATDPAFVASAVADARSGAEAFARVYHDEFDRYAAIDLHHFASILAQRSPDPLVVKLASDVMGAIEAAVIRYARGSGFKNSGGIATYFPRTAELYIPQYAQASALPAWNQFLNSYHQAGLADLPAPQIDFTNVLTEAAGIQNPAYLEFEIIGRDVERVRLIAGRYESDGRRRLVEYDNLIPEPTHLPSGDQLFEWRDGVHEDFFIWDTRVTYLYDMEGNGDYVVMWPTDYGSLLFSVQGRYRRRSAGEYFDAFLVFDHARGEMARVWGLQGVAAAEILPEPGDEFQLYTPFRQVGGNVTYEPGVNLIFDALGRLYFDWRPLPDGDYFAGFVVENVAGDTAEAFTDVTVNNSENQTAFKAYLDPYLGFQFYYPESWSVPTYDASFLYTTNVSATTELQITLYPNLEPSESARTLQNQTLNQFGAVDLLYPAETIAVAGIPGLRAAYGYEKIDEGPRTGILVTFVKDGVGYVVDIDGPLNDEIATISAINQILNSWQFRPARFGLYPGKWAQIDLASFTVAQPADFLYQEVNGWQRFSSDRNTFVALRTQPSTREAIEVLSALIRDAGADVDEFSAGEPYRLPLAGAVWLRSDFGYVSASGIEIWGFIMVKVDSNREVVSWSEAPASSYNELESSVFLTMIADMVLSE